MEKYEKPLIDEWPQISFKLLEDVEVEGSMLNFLYKSFFKTLRLPETTLKAFLTLFQQN